MDNYRGSKLENLGKADSYQESELLVEMQIKLLSQESLAVQLRHKTHETQDDAKATCAFFI